MRNLGDFKDLYNTQDVILLCGILESRLQAMQNTYGFNPRKCNSLSTMSGCTEREMSKVIITIPTKIKHVETFEQTVISSFSCVNNRLAFDTQLLLPNFVDSDMTVKKDFNYKIAYNLKTAENQKVKKRIISKILKLDENNQFGHGMTKSLPTGCIKDNSDLSWETFNLLLESVSLEDRIGHLYIVDIEFDTKNASEKILAYNEIYPPIIEKQKVIDPCERSTYQLLEQFVMGEKGPFSYKKSAKAHANLFKKFFQPMYLEDLAFCIKRVGWKVTKIHAHLTCEQSRVKGNFILMNQKSRQLSKNDVEKDFFKLMNNSNFGYDCRNNLDNCKFNPIFGELGEITYINRYHNIFDEKVSSFVSTDLVKQHVEEKFNDKLAKLHKEDQFYNIKFQTIKDERLVELEAAEKLDGNKKKNKKRIKLVDLSEREKEALTNQKIKSLIDCDEQYSASIKSLSIQKNTKIDLTARFLNGKMLMFSKVSIKSFLYDIIDVFMFPNKEIKTIYQTYKINKCLVNQNLTDTDSTSIYFFFFFFFLYLFAIWRVKFEKMKLETLFSM